MTVQFNMFSMWVFDNLFQSFSERYFVMNQWFVVLSSEYFVVYVVFSLAVHVKRSSEQYSFPIVVFLVVKILSAVCRNGINSASWNLCCCCWVGDFSPSCRSEFITSWMEFWRQSVAGKLSSWFWCDYRFRIQRIPNEKYHAYRNAPRRSRQSTFFDEPIFSN